MKQLRIVCVVLSSILLFACCKTLHFPPTKEKAEEQKTLLQTLDTQKERMMQVWLSSAKERWQWFKEAYNEKLSDADIPDMKIVSVSVYRMDSLSFYNCNSDRDIINSIALETKKGKYLVLLRDSAFVARYDALCYPNGWMRGGYGGIFDGIAQKYYELYKKGIPFYTLHVYYYKTNDPPVWAFYNNGKKLMSIHSDGSESPLIEDLNKRRKELLEWYKLHKK
jgi:hypothetical protein